MLEKDFMRQVINLAKFYGWKVAHFGASVRVVGKDRTFVGDRDSTGFPDLVLVRGERLIFAELKAEKGKVSPAQTAWLVSLTGHSDRPREVYLWYPKDWKIIEETLKKEKVLVENL